MNRKMGKAGICYLLVSIVNAVISFISVSAFSNVMTTEQYGLFTGFKAWGELLVPMMGLQLSSALMPARNEFLADEDFRKYHLSVLRLLWVLGGLFLAGGLASGLVFHQSLLYIAAVLLFAFARSALDYYNNYWVICGRYQIYGKVNLFYYIGSFLLPFLFMWLLPDLGSYVNRTIGFIVAALAAILPIMLFELRASGKLILRNMLAHWRYALVIAWPCVFTGLSSMALGQADRLILKAVRGDSETGIYGLVYNFTIMVQMFSISVISMWQPRFISLYQKKDYKQIKEDIGFYLSFIAVISIGVFLLAPEIIRIMAPEAYWSGIPMTAFLIGGVFFHAAATFPKYVLVINKRTRLQAIIMIVTLVFSIISNILLIPYFGMFAAAITTLCAYGIEFMLSIVIAIQTDRSAIDLKRIGLCCGMLLLAMAANYLFLSLALVRWAIGFLLGISWIVAEWKKIKQFFVPA